MPGLEDVTPTPDPRPAPASAPDAAPSPPTSAPDAVANGPVAVDAPEAAGSPVDRLLAEMERAVGLNDALTAELAATKATLAVRDRELAEARNAAQQAATRARADHQNLKRRSEEALSAASVNAIADFAPDMLAVLDELELAIGTMPDGDVRRGFEMVASRFIREFERVGITRLKAVGQEYDPQLHHVITIKQSAEATSTTVETEFQAGYVLGDRLIRAASVGVVEPA